MSLLRRRQCTQCNQPAAIAPETICRTVLLQHQRVSHRDFMQNTASGRILAEHSNLDRLGHYVWQVFILDSLATYRPRDSKDAESIVERVTPRLQHANCAVVLSAVKVCVGAVSMRYM